MATSGSIGDRRLDERTVVGGISNGTQLDASQGYLYVRGETGQFYTRHGIRQQFQPRLSNDDNNNLLLFDGYESRKLSMFC